MTQNGSYFASRSWRFVSFNVENLFIYLDSALARDPSTLSEQQWQALSSSTLENKPLKQVLDLARAVKELDPDILMLCEVGGRESLANFSRYFLSDVYVPYLIEGNSDRGIDLGFLVRRSLPLKYDMISHKSRKLDFLYPHEKLSREAGYSHLRSAQKTSHRFSRDVVELRCFGADDSRPEFILMLVHLKSPLDRDRIDPGGRDRRRAELEMLVKIYREVNEEFGGTVPIFIGGDFNGVVSGLMLDPEFEAIRQTDLRCCLELAGVHEDERFTWMHLRNKRPALNRQIDYILVPQRLKERVSSDETWVYRFKDEFGMNRIIPRNFNEKRLLPSDHYPVVLTLTSSHSPQRS